MAMLQISEPGSVDKNTTGHVIGIDLGTTHSLVAYSVSNTPVIIPSDTGNPLVPSVVYFPESGAPLVGAEAVAMRAHDSRNAVASVKRYMGVAGGDIDGVSEQHIDCQGTTPRLLTNAGLLTAQEISAYILRALKDRALTILDSIDGAVITVPAYFDDSQRQATKDAARLAGIPLLRLLNEPTAAALAYGLEREQDGIVAVYDLGGGTFDLSILRLQEGVFQVLATAGDTRLGGDDFDTALGAIIADTIGKSVTNFSARQIKEQLSEQTEVAVNIGDQQLHVTRDMMDIAIKPLIEKTLKLCRQAISDAQLGAADISHMVLVGGSTRTPQVHQALATAFPEITLHSDMDPDTTVALGAALQAEMLAGNERDLLLLDVLPLSLGIETMGSLVERVIPRNSTIPASRAQEFTTWKEGQTAMLIHVVQGERDKVEDCRSLARFELRGIPPRAAGAAKIRVTFTVDADGILQVTAQELSTGIQAHVSVQPSSGLREDEIETMLQLAWQQADEDKAARSYQQAIVEAQRLIQATEQALNEDGDLLSDDQRHSIEEILKGLQAQLDSGTQQTGVVEQATDTLTKATDTFASKRMDRAVAKALTGTRPE